jgi:hypothetical protein
VQGEIFRPVYYPSVSTQNESGKAFKTLAASVIVVTETVKVTRKTYSQSWGAYNQAQTHEKSELQALSMSFAETCQSLSNAQADRACLWPTPSFHSATKCIRRYPVGASQPI